MKRLRWLAVPLVLAVVAAIVVSQFQFKASFVGHVSIANAQVLDTSPPSLDIRFEPSGTHVDEQGNLKIRLDFYPTPDSKSYVLQHVEVTDTTSKEYTDGYPGKVDKDGHPLDEVEYQKWLDGLPKVWVTNPALCHFLTVKSDITVTHLSALVLDMFPGSVTATIDDVMIQANSAHLISPYMRDKSSTTLSKVAPTEDKVSLVDAVNTRLAGFNIPAGSSGGTIEPIQPKSIDVGAGATDRASSFAFYSHLVDLTNPANDTGTLDTWEMFFLSGSGGTNVKVATHYVVSGNYLSSREVETIGTVTAGSKQTFTGLSTDVSTGDMVGATAASSGSIEADPSGGSGVYYRFGGTLPITNQSFSFLANYKLSIYATGTEAATFAITNDPATKAFGVVAVSSTYYAFGSAPSNPVADNETTYTLTETGGSACDIDIHGHNSTGGGGMTIVSGAPGANQFRITAYKGGDNPASGLVITTSDQEFKDNLAAAGHFHWDFCLESGSSFTETAQQTTTLTLTARAHS